MKKSELLKLFKKNGVYLVREGKRHEIYYSPEAGREIPVSRTAKEIPTGTLASILKDAGL